MEKINIAVLLKDCPTGLELDCTIFDTKVFYRGFSKNPTLPIVVQTEHGFEFELTQYGQTHNIVGSKCVIFPKGKTTWEGFVPPCQFKDGDIVAMKNDCGIHTFIYNHTTNEYGGCGYYVIFTSRGNFKINGFCCGNTYRLSTEEEKQKLFDAIKEHGYKWNPEIKTLYKVAKLNFKAGDWITNGDYTWKVISIDNFDYTLQNQLGECVEDTIDYVNRVFHLWTIKDAKDGDALTTDSVIFIFKSQDNRDCYMHCNYAVASNNFSTSDTAIVDSMYVHPATKEQRDILFQKMKEVGYKWNPETKTLGKLVEPWFKVGDRIKHIVGREEVATVVGVGELHYTLDSKVGTSSFSISLQREWELVSNKFDITTLKPFESRVLVRDSSVGIWLPEFFACVCDNHDCPYMIIGGTRWKCCIPFEGNEHLMCKTDDCDEYYKNWE